MIIKRLQSKRPVLRTEVRICAEARPEPGCRRYMLTTQHLAPFSYAAKADFADHADCPSHMHHTSRID